MAKILIVDDSPTIAAVFKRLFVRAGHDVSVASDGNSGLSAAQQQHPDLVVLDNMLPGMNGFDICRVLKGDATLKSTKVLLLTGSQDEASVKEGKQAGADAYLTKDCGIARVIEAAGHLLGNGSAI